MAAFQSAVTILDYYEFSMATNTVAIHKPWLMYVYVIY